jgi:hypothetical protein
MRKSVLDFAASLYNSLRSCCLSRFSNACFRVCSVLAQAAQGFNGGRVGARSGLPGTRVYVGNLSWDAQWQDLKDHMRGPNQDLNVLHADIMTEANGALARVQFVWRAIAGMLN